MYKQEVKIECDGTEFFFFQHSFKTAMEHAKDFIERNRGKFNMKLFVLNPSNYGEQWLLREVINIYKAYGDVNPIEHGGQWIKKVFVNTYEIITIQPMEDCERPTILIGECQVDINDTWIDKEAVISYCGETEEEEVFALNVVSYYGAVNCGGTEEKWCAEQVESRLKSLSIEVSE